MFIYKAGFQDALAYEHEEHDIPAGIYTELDLAKDNAIEKSNYRQEEPCDVPYVKVFELKGKEFVFLEEWIYRNGEWN